MPKKTTKKIFGVLGYPVKHSLSPAMHNAAFRQLKIKASYKKFEVRPEELGRFLKTIEAKNICGLNVTAPHKEKILSYLTGYKTSAADEIGAVNTIVVSKDNRLKGYNTDYLGFSKHLSGLGLRPKRIAIIGAGGAAKAVCFSLAKKGASQIAIYDIDRYKSISLMQRLQESFPGCGLIAVDSIEGLELSDKDLLVNASPVGMKPEDRCLITAAMLPSSIFVYDLIYNPAETKLLSLARQKGLRYSNGLGMLLYQGAESFNLWMKPKKAPLAVMSAALKQALRKKFKV
ncbi:MAG: shikimate dehydrogenase [Candidatus Omnitrophica bacterium]|nr:shikimate dehydrogenase [Candidatus Omnitrophota bacterium]